MLLLSAVGTVASLVFLAVRHDPDVGSGMGIARTLLGVTFVLWILTLSLVRKLAPSLRDRLLWKGVLRGCPRWMRIGLRIVLVSTFFVGLVLAMQRHFGGFIVFLAGLYSISFCVTYSFLHARPAARNDKSTVS